MNLDAIRARAALNAHIRKFFADRDFIEVETPHLVEAAGTDPYLDPIPAQLTLGSDRRAMSLHTSPEFAMKELVAAGLERIYQLCHVWRDGEVTSQHNPEFTLLEWYRTGVSSDVIMDDVEHLVAPVLSGANGGAAAGRGFARITMRDAWLQGCGIDPIETAGDLSALSTASGIDRWDRWDELFFELMLERVEPWLAEQGAVFVTEWPVQLAVLARRCDHDPRVAERFELYVDGVELCNGFGELTDPVEQRARFEEDNAQRRALGKPEQTMPERFLAVLERGLPECSGVAVGIDRLLMLQLGTDDIRDVLPFAIGR